MINEVDEALRSLVKADVVHGADIEVLFEAPTREWASRRNTPAVDLYLYDLREDTKRRSAGMIERRNERGVVTDRQALPRYFKLAYLITAWTQRPEDEHRLLSAILACFMRYDVLPRPFLTPVLAETGFPLALQIAYPPPDDRQVSDVWSSVGGDLKPSVDLVVTMAIQPEQFYDIAQAVMAPMRLRAVGQVTFPDAEDDVRYKRDPVDATTTSTAVSDITPVADAAVGDDAPTGAAKARRSGPAVGGKARKTPRSSDP